jgi:Predicted signaling protein consisting of a modified GGDEF domain and a DHH domain
MGGQLEKKSDISRFLRPSMRLYFAFLVLFIIITFMFDYKPAVAELIILVVILLYTRIVNKMHKNEVLSYIHASAYSTQDASTNSFLNMPLPMVIFSLNDGKVLWSNDSFLAITGDRKHMFEVDITDMIPGFTRKWLAEGEALLPSLSA